MPFQNYMRRIAISQIMNKISLIITIIIYQLNDKKLIFLAAICFYMYLITNIKLNDYCKMVQIMEIVLSEPKSNFDTGK